MTLMLRGSDGEGRPFEASLFPVERGAKRRLRFRLTAPVLAHWPVFAVTGRGGARYIDRRTRRLIHSLEGVSARCVGRVSFRVADAPLGYGLSVCHLTLSIGADGWLTAEIAPVYGGGQHVRTERIAPLLSPLLPRSAREEERAAPDRPSVGRRRWRLARLGASARRKCPCPLVIR